MLQEREIGLFEAKLLMSESMHAYSVWTNYILYPSIKREVELIRRKTFFAFSAKLPERHHGSSSN